MRCMIICINGIQYVASQLKPQPRFGHDQGNENSESWMTFFLLWQSGEKQGERQESATFATFSLWLAWRHPLFHPFCIFFFFALRGRRQLVQDYVLWHCAAINFYGTSGRRMSMWWAVVENSLTPRLLICHTARIRDFLGLGAKRR